MSSSPPRGRSQVARPAPAVLPDVNAYRRALVPWYRRHARDLPWRRNPTPYRVWVSEIMLQQTRVEAVIPRFERFLARFPRLEDLAGASEEEVLEAWSGLGYYRRARMLRAGARRVIDLHGGTFPADEREARAIPGVGRYTAGAIRSIALGVRSPVLDGNVTRLLARVFGIRGDVTRAPVAGELWKIAARAVERGHPGEVNQAQMEFGARVCVSSRPGCPACPLRRICVARRDALVDVLPELPPRRPTVAVGRTVLLIRRGGHLLLRKRLPEELSPGLWDLPGAFTGAGGDRSAGPAEAVRLLPFPVDVGSCLGVVRHAITYRRITLDVREARPAPGGQPGRVPARRALERAARAPAAPRGPDGAELLWCRAEEALGKALSSPARRIVHRWGAQGCRGASARRDGAP